MDLIVDLSRGTALVVGTMTRALVVEPGPADLIGVRFRPGRAPALLGLPASEARDDALDADDVGRALGARELALRLAEARGEAERLALLARALARRVEEAEPGPVVGLAALGRLEREPATRVDALARGLAVSERQLERHLLALVGVGPKAFARIVRFRRLVAALEAGTAANGAALAAALGYSDQPHLAREFRALAGVSPTAYLRERAGLTPD